MSTSPEGGGTASLPDAIVRVMGLLQPRSILAEACRQAAALCGAEAALAVAAGAGERWTEDCYALSRGAGDPDQWPPAAARAAMLELQSRLAGAPGPLSAEPARPELAALVHREGQREALIWAVPLRGPGQAVCGALAVLAGAGDAVKRVRPAELAFLGSAAGAALGNAVELAEARRLRESAGRLQFLAEVSRTLSQATLAPEHLYQTVARAVAERMGDSCTVRILSPDGTQAHTAGFFHRDPELNERLREAVKVPDRAFEGLTGQMLHSRRRLLIPRAGSEELRRQMRHSSLKDALPATPSSSVLGAPISLRGRMLGALICTRRGTDPYTEGEATLLQDLADRVALAVANAQQQDALRDREERLRLAVEATRLGTWELSPESRLIRCDARCRELLWIQEDRAIPYDRFVQRIHPDHRSRAVALLAAAEGGGGAEMRVELRTHRDGTEHWIEMHARRTVSEVLPLHRLIGTVLDITERKRTERQLTEAIRARDEFLSIASHELRTPLTPLRLQLETVRRSLERPAPDERMAERLDVALRQAHRLSKLVENLLDVSRITAGRMSLELEQCSLAEVARDVVERFQEEAARAGCPIELRLSEGATGLWDRSRLEQVASNLLSNAIKYAPGRPIEVAVSAEPRSATVSVSDQGIGVAKEDAKRIFHRFERAVSVRHYGGLGLGLYIARQIAEAHGGQISVSGRPGGGSVFTMTLPKRPVDLLVAPAESAVPAGN